MVRFAVVLVVLVLGACSCSVDAGGVGGDSLETTQAPSTTLEVTTTTVAPETATTVSPITIMHIGDELTLGSTDWSTYRCFLDAMLSDAGVSFDFVGSRSEPHHGGPYGCPTDFDTDHEAWYGVRLGGLELEGVTDRVAVLQPDAALVLLGLANIAHGQGPASTAAELESLITGLQAVSPDMTILVAQLFPCNTPLPWCTEDFPAFNDAIAGFSSLSTDESSVVVVDMYTGFSLDHLRDSLHTNDDGDEFLASRWMTGLREAGVIGSSG